MVIHYHRKALLEVSTAFKQFCCPTFPSVTKCVEVFAHRAIRQQVSKSKSVAPCAFPSPGGAKLLVVELLVAIHIIVPDVRIYPLLKSLHVPSN